jgi:hypothetical protein
MRFKSILRVSASLGLILVMASACSSSDNSTNSKIETTEGRVAWSNTDSLEIPLKQAVSQSCPNFDAETASLTFEGDYADFNLRLINLDDAKLLLYLDGAIEPEIEDEFSTVRFYEEWGCTEDTLYIQELRFSGGDFYGNENPISIFNCLDEYESQPSNLIITCADANMGVENIIWKSWNNIEASGEGIFYENNCSPDCASGRIIRQKAEIQLSNIQRDKSGKSVFTEIIVQTKEKQQAGGYMDTYSLYFEE